MKGLTANQFRTYLAIIIGVFTLSSLIPHAIWIASEGDIVCPTEISFEKNRTEFELKLWNSGETPATFTVCIEVNGLRIEQNCISYAIDKKKSASYRFSLERNSDINQFSVRATVSCFLLPPFYIPCFGTSLSCDYNLSASYAYKTVFKLTR